MERTNGINPSKPWDATGKVWTVAYRKRTGPVFHRVTNWAGTWDQAEDMARRLMVARPDFQVWYVPTLAYEQANPGHEDNGAVLTDSGKRVKIRDNGTLPEGLLAEAARDRHDLLIPGRQIRDEQGRVIGAESLSRLPRE